MDLLDTPRSESSATRFDAHDNRLSCAARAASASRARTATRLSSETLFGTGHEIEISHGQAVYRLRITSLGKLILTK